MRSIIRKEWRELRMIPIGIALLFAALNLLCISLEYSLVRVGGSSWRLGASIALGNVIAPAGALLICLASILSGSSLFSREIGRGTLQFLTALPVSRRSLWTAKFCAGLLSILASLLSVAVIGGVADWLRFGWSSHRAVQFAGQLSALTATHMSAFYYAAIPLMIVGGCFAISMAISNLVDRTLNSAILSVIACLGAPLAVILTIGTYAHYFRDVNWRILDPILIAGTILCILFASYYTFVHGDTLRSQRRFVLTGSVLGGWAIVSAMVIVGLHFIAQRSL